jgi:hypothetical protein
MVLTSAIHMAPGGFPLSFRTSSVLSGRTQHMDQNLNWRVMRLERRVWMGYFESGYSNLDCITCGFRWEVRVRLVEKEINVVRCTVVTWDIEWLISNRCRWLILILKWVIWIWIGSFDGFRWWGKRFTISISRKEREDIPLGPPWSLRLLNSFHINISISCLFLAVTAPAN